MKTVFQRNQGDCGVAALAMLAGVSYKRAFEYLERRYSRTRTISSGKIISGLNHFGRMPLSDRCVSVKGCPELYNLEHHALLGGDLLEPQPKGGWKKHRHWAAWDVDEQCVRDPYGCDYPFLIRKIVQVA